MSARLFRAAVACAAGLSLGLPGRAAASDAPAARLIVIDPGHGGEDLGAAIRGAREKDIALAIARRLKSALETSGRVRAVLLRQDDLYVPLDERVEKAVELKAAEFISLHVNQVRSKRAHGISVYSYGRGFRFWPRRRHPVHHVRPLPAPPRAVSAAGLGLARDVVEGLRESGLRTEGVTRSDYYVLKNPEVPSVLVELGFISNPGEAALLKDPGYQERLARALARGLLEYERSDTVSQGSGVAWR